MKLGLHTMRSTVNFGLWGSGVDPTLAVVQRAESLGYDSVWTAEAAGTDAVVPLAWLAAHTSRIKLGTGILQLTARTPTTTAMTAATFDHLSGGRFILGLGASGPAVVEGWHSASYRWPLDRTREYIDVVRRVHARTAPVEFHGDHYDIPYRGTDGTGLGEPIRLMFRPRRRRIPIYLAALGAQNLSLAYEIADGIIPAFYSPYREDAFFADVDDHGRRSEVELAPFVSVSMGDDVATCRDRLKPGLAFWIGGMGAKGLNFYNRFVRRLGFEGFAEDVQRLYTSGQRSAAAAVIPDELVDEVALCGPRERIAERLEAWEKSSVGTMILTGIDEDTVVAMAELAAV